MSGRKNQTQNTNCNNCGTALLGKHCHQCGQSASVSRLSLHDIFHEAWHAVTHTDKGVLRLVKELTLSPKDVYLNYFEGQRKKYFSPVLFFLVTAGILAFLYPYVFDYEDKITNRLNEYSRTLYHLTKYRALILLPLQTLLLWVFFGRRFNLAEITVFLLYCIGFTYAIRIIFLPLYFPLIRYKDHVDSVFTNLSLLILWIHGSLVLGRGRIWNILLMFLVVNVYIIFDSLLQVYILFGFDFIHTNNNGIKSYWDVIKDAYILWPGA